MNDADHSHHHDGDTHSGCGCSAKTATKTTSDDTAKPAKPASPSNALAFPQNYAAEDNASPSGPRKN